MSDRNGLEIAVISMSGRFPRAMDLDQFWQNLRNGVEGISFFTEQEVEAADEEEIYEGGARQE